MLTQDPTVSSFLKALYGYFTIDTSLFDSPYRWVYSIAGMQDAIVNGPFGDLRGKYWGGDVGNTRVVKVMPSYVLSYSTGNTNRSGYLLFPKPIPRANWGSGTNVGTVYNYALFANMMPWAIEQAEFNGINTKVK